VRPTVALMVLLSALLLGCEGREQRLTAQGNALVENFDLLLSFEIEASRAARPAISGYRTAPLANAASLERAAPSMSRASRVGQPDRCCSAIVPSAAIQAASSFRQGM
jgi:hypothetical protein